MPRAVAAQHAGARRRVVFGYNALREKALCAAAGLDDVALEAMKITLMSHNRDWLTPDPDGLLLIDIDPDSGGLLMRHQSGDATRHAAVPRAAYERVAALRPSWAGAFSALYDTPYVHMGRCLPEGLGAPPGGPSSG